VTHLGVICVCFVFCFFSGSCSYSCDFANLPGLGLEVLILYSVVKYYNEV
jgi:hypothetical protein